MERYVVVVLVHLVQPLAQRFPRDLELFQQAQLDEHGLHQMDHLPVLPLVRVERRQPEGGLHLLRQGLVGNLQEALFDIGVLGQTDLPMGRSTGPARETY